MREKKRKIDCLLIFFFSFLPKKTHTYIIILKNKEEHTEIGEKKKETHTRG